MIQRVGASERLCLARTNRDDEASDEFKAALDIAPYTGLAGRIRTELNRLADARKAGPVREDVVAQMVEAMRLFRERGEGFVKRVTAEVAFLGQSGLDTKDPQPRHALRSLDGKFTGRQLLAILYAGLKELSPETNPGVDFEKEYREAKRRIASR